MNAHLGGRQAATGLLLILRTDAGFSVALGNKFDRAPAINLLGGTTLGGTTLGGTTLGGTTLGRTTLRHTLGRTTLLGRRTALLARRTALLARRTALLEEEVKLSNLATGNGKLLLGHTLGHTLGKGS